MIEFILATLGVLVAAFGIWWTHFRAGRLVVFGETGYEQAFTTSRDILSFTIRVRNTGAVPIQLKQLYLHELPQKKWPGSRRHLWSLIDLEVDGKQIELNRSPLSFNGAESRKLNCKFMSLDKFSQGSVYITYAALILTEKTRFKERKRSALIIQVGVGDRIEIVFPHSEYYLPGLLNE